MMTTHTWGSFLRFSMSEHTHAERSIFHLICKKLLELLEDLPDKGDIQKILEERAKKLLEEPEGQNHGGKS